MKGVITIKEGEDRAKKIRVSANGKNNNSGSEKLFLIIFWIAVLLFGLYLLSDLTNGFSDVKNMIGYFGA